MVRSSKKRLEKYTAKTDPDVLKMQIAGLKASMVRYQTTYFKEISEIETRTKALIEKEGVSVFEVPNYLLFSREIFKLKTKFSKRTLDLESLLRLNKWVDRGLNLDLLQDVAKLQGVKIPYVPPTPPYPPMVGTANVEDVIKDLTFYKDSPEEKLTGILELTGNAQPSDVEGNKTFYNTDPKTKLTGSLPVAPISPTLIDSHKALNATTTVDILHPSSSLSKSGQGQSFTAPAQSFMLHSIHFQIYRTGLPEVYRARLYSHLGTYGVNSIPNEADILAESDSLNAFDLGTVQAWLPFYFTGKQRVTLIPSTYYVVALIAKSGLWNATNYVIIRLSTTSLHSGNRSTFADGSWGATAAQDLGFQVFGIPV